MNRQDVIREVIAQFAYEAGQTVAPGGGVNLPGEYTAYCVEDDVNAVTAVIETPAGYQYQLSGDNPETLANFLVNTWNETGGKQ